MKLKDKFAKIARSRGFKAVIAAIVVLISAFAIYKKVKRKGGSNETVEIPTPVVERMVQEESAMTKEIEDAVNVVETVESQPVASNKPDISTKVNSSRDADSLSATERVKSNLATLTAQNKDSIRHDVRTANSIGRRYRKSLEIDWKNDLPEVSATSAANANSLVRGNRILGMGYATKADMTRNLMNNAISSVGGFKNISREVCVDIDKTIDACNRLAERHMQKIDEIRFDGALVDVVEFNKDLEVMKKKSIAAIRDEMRDRPADPNFTARWDAVNKT